jgi:hypothetical protein
VLEESPQVFVRLGSHSEKEYVEKTIKYFDGLIVGANLLQASPGATASLILKLRCPYLIDPMTYAFGTYVDPVSLKLRKDLDWIKSDQRVRGAKKGVVKRDFKSSYRKLAEAFGTPFSSALNRKSAITADDFADEQTLDDACRSVLNYQMQRLKDVFKEDPETAVFANNLPDPSGLFAPYFYIEESSATDWVALNQRLALSATKLSNGAPVHVVVCGYRNLVRDQSLSSQIFKNLIECKPAAVWLWFSRFDEHSAAKEDLLALRGWVERLAATTSVFNMHGGFFSLALSKVGMSGIAHGVGYGEQKDVVPVIGQSTPTVQYYVRSLHSKYSVPEINRCFSILNIKTDQDFFSKICDCVVCKGIIDSTLETFSQFGEIHYSTPTSRRAAQTPAAAKRCRFHFLLNRLKEREYVKESDLKKIVEDCETAAKLWPKKVISRGLDHLILWSEALKQRAE